MRNWTLLLGFLLLLLTDSWVGGNNTPSSPVGGGVSKHRRRHSGVPESHTDEQSSKPPSAVAAAALLADGQQPQSAAIPPAAPSWLAPAELVRAVVEPLNKRGLSLACRSIGHPRPTITWTKDGVNVETDRQSADPFGLLKVRGIFIKYIFSFFFSRVAGAAHFFTFPAPGKFRFRFRLLLLLLLKSNNR